MRQREDLSAGKEKVESFLTHLAVEGQVAPATQNQALNEFAKEPGTTENKKAALPY